MFSGIIECQSKLKGLVEESSVIRIKIERPSFFEDLSVGDSLAVDGVCLTIEGFDADQMTLAIGHETLKITGWSPEFLQDRIFNLERSLCLGERIHGHMVSGHVDGVGQVLAGPTNKGILKICIPAQLKSFFWKKGSMAVNGVSLTINEIKKEVVEFCLVPETLNRTNLNTLKPEARVNIEVDSWARALFHFNQANFASHQTTSLKPKTLSKSECFRKDQN